MSDRIYDDIEVISSYTVDDAIGDGALIEPAPGTGLACIQPLKAHVIKPLKDMTGLDDYLKNYGSILGRKAIHALAPLHVPGRDPLPDFDDILREPFPCQQHVIASTVKMLDKVQNGFIVGEMGTGKTLLGMVGVHKHAQRPRGQGGSGGKYRVLILCPDHLIGKWCRELEETIPDAIISRFGPQGDEIKPAKGTKRKKGEEKLDANAKRTLRDVVAQLTGVDVQFESEGDRPQGESETYSVCTGVDTYEDRPLTPKASSGKIIRREKRWEKPQGAEWFVLGRNQAKWLSDWTGIADKTLGFNAIKGALTQIAVASMVGRCQDGTLVGPTSWVTPMPTVPVPKQNALSSRNMVIDKVIVEDEKGYPTYDKNGRVIKKNVTARVHYCPSCGHVVRDKKGSPVSVKTLQNNGSGSAQQVCKGTYLQMLPAAPDRKPHGLPRMRVDAGSGAHGHGTEQERFGPILARPGEVVKAHGGYSWVVKECKEPLFNYTAKPYRWSPARIVQKQCKRMFKYLVIDEVHEQKSDESAQSMACGKLIASVDHVIALTGTIIGGYADHLHPLLMRLAPATLKQEGFEWGKKMPFSEAYGRIDRVVTTKEADDGGPSVRGNAKSMRRAKSGSRDEKKYVRPGVMPTLFGRHMIGCSMFITLDELASELPDLFEYVGGEMGSAPRLADFWDDSEETAEEKYEHALARYAKQADGWFETACDMEPAQSEEYKRVAAILEFANRELLKKGCMKLLGTMLWTTMDYPDKPFGWGHDKDMLKDLKAAHKKVGDLDEALEKLKLVHTVGFWDKPGIRTIDNFVGVVTPKDCPEDVVYPKERALIDCCLKQKKDGRQTWVYVNMTGKRNVQPRLKMLLEAEGLKVGILRSDDVEPIDREEWITKNGRDFDVMISHPQLVSTGLDLFSKVQGGHNYSTLVFYETGYNLFTMRQAARRAWRIGQPHDCRVYYFYYKETMQHKAMSLMSKKMQAAQALEGEFSEEGLAAMSGEDNVQMALAKNLSERIDDKDMQRSWGKVKSGPKKVKRPTSAVAALTHDAKPSPLDDLPIELQMVAETLIENQGKPVPADALAEFGKLGADLAALDAGFDAVAASEEFAHHAADETEEGDDDEDVEAEDLVIIERAAEPEPVADEESEWDFDDDPDFAAGGKYELTEVVLAKMFANMMSAGLSV